MYISGRGGADPRAVGGGGSGKRPVSPCSWTGRAKAYASVYNGELYNTPELRAALQNKGHSFTGHSDTEVLLHAFAEWGAGCVDRCNGIFAFAVWEAAGGHAVFGAGPLRRQAAVLRAGQRTACMFGSEIKTLLAHPAVPPRVDANGLAEVLLLGPGRTPGCGVFQNVRELLPGQYADV